MALKHQLSLNIVAGCNPNNFTIIDTSNYSSGISISCPTLAITIPGTSGPVYFSQGTNPAPGLDPEDVYHLLPTTPDPYTGTPKFVITVDNILLCLQAQGSTLTALYDGLWTIEYCVNPCTTTSVKYYYLRNTSALHKYAGLLCKLRLSNCLPSDETKKMIDELHIIKMYLDGAKAKIENCHAPNEGLAMHDYALYLMDNWERACCTTC